MQSDEENIAEGRGRKIKRVDERWRWKSSMKGRDRQRGKKKKMTTIHFHLSVPWAGDRESEKEEVGVTWMHARVLSNHSPLTYSSLAASLRHFRDQVSFSSILPKRNDFIFQAQSWLHKTVGNSFFFLPLPSFFAKWWIDLPVVSLRTEGVGCLFSGYDSPPNQCTTKRGPVHSWQAQKGTQSGIGIKWNSLLLFLGPEMMDTTNRVWTTGWQTQNEGDMQITVTGLDATHVTSG